MRFEFVERIEVLGHFAVIRLVVVSSQVAGRAADLLGFAGAYAPSLLEERENAEERFRPFARKLQTVAHRRSESVLQFPLAKSSRRDP